MKKTITLLYFIALSFAGNCETADFTFQSNNGLFCEPSTIQFTHTSSGNPTGFVWDFGNNSGSNAADPAVVYTVAGTYIVTLLVIYQQSTVEVSKTIVINRSVTATLTADRNFICTPGPISFTANATENIANYQWDFGDGTGIITTASNTTVHNYTGFGSYDAVVKATTSAGCFATATRHVSVDKPGIFPSATPALGCIPASVIFNANVLVPTGGSVTSYTWNFGDGSPAVTITAANSTTHVYNITGSFLPTISIVTNEGCTNTYNFAAIAFGSPPVNHVSYPKKPVICGSETAVFVSKATNANSYYWDFGDGTNTTVTDTLATHKYTTLGTKTITAIPRFNGCPGTPISFTIDVVGVIAGYTYANTCSNPHQYSFTNSSQGNMSIISWNMGDASPLLNTVNVVHGFPSSGSFNTTLTVTDNITGCIDSFSRTIYTATPLLANPDVAICKNSNTSFTILNGYQNPAATYTWNVAGIQSGPANLPSLTVNANILGNFTANYVIINNGPESCPDTVNLPNPLLVKGPNLNFNYTDNICLGSATTITNTSQPFIASDTVRTWYWNFGISANDSIYQPQPYSDFLYAGPWHIKLTAIDKNGCRDTLDKIITVNPTPFMRTVPGSDTLCLGSSDTLIAFHTNDILWSPANLVSCATCDTVTINPTVNTNFYATATNSFGCVAKDSVLIKLFAPFTATATPVDFYTCRNETVQLNVSPPAKKVLWSPATGLSNAGVYNPLASATQNTVYTATLTDSAGCFSSTANVNLFIKSTPVVNAGPDMFYPFNTAFSFTPTYSGNISSYLWTPSSLLDCSTCAVPNGIASTSQTYTLTVTSDSGCVATDNVNIFVECKAANLYLPTAFTPNNDGLNDYFYPMTRGIKNINHFIIYNRQGQLVFEAKNFSPNTRKSGWDGNYKGAAESSGSYVYFLDATCEAGETLHKKGSVILIR